MHKSLVCIICIFAVLVLVETKPSPCEGGWRCNWKNRKPRDNSLDDQQQWSGDNIVREDKRVRQRQYGGYNGQSSWGRNDDDSDERQQWSNSFQHSWSERQQWRGSWRERQHWNTRDNDSSGNVNGSKRNGNRGCNGWRCEGQNFIQNIGNGQRNNNTVVLQNSSNQNSSGIHQQLRVNDTDRNDTRTRQQWYDRGSNYQNNWDRQREWGGGGYSHYSSVEQQQRRGNRRHSWGGNRGCNGSSCGGEIFIQNIGNGQRNNNTVLLQKSSGNGHNSSGENQQLSSGDKGQINTQIRQQWHGGGNGQNSWGRQRQTGRGDYDQNDSGEHQQWRDRLHFSWDDQQQWRDNRRYNWGERKVWNSNDNDNSDERDINISSGDNRGCSGPSCEEEGTIIQNIGNGRGNINNVRL